MLLVVLFALLLSIPFFFSRALNATLFPLAPNASNAYRLVFDVQSTRFPTVHRRIAPGIVRMDQTTQSLAYIFVDSAGISSERPPRDAEAYSYPTLSMTTEIHVLKPQSGSWHFQVTYTTERFLVIPFFKIQLASHDLILPSELFTNQFRPPDVHALTTNRPFE